MTYADVITYKRATENMIRLHENSLVRLLTEAVEYTEWMEDANNHSSGYRSIGEALRQQISIIKDHLTVSK